MRPRTRVRIQTTMPFRWRMIWVRLGSDGNTLDLSDEDDVKVPSTADNGAEGMAPEGQEEELRMEIQQRDTIIQIKTDEIRRLSLQNHDYENEVQFLPAGDVIGSQTETATG